MSEKRTVTGAEAHEEVMERYQRMREDGTLKATCHECVWFAGTTGDGDCRLNGPVADPELKNQFPTVSSGCWCAKFESRDMFTGRPPTVGEMTERSLGKPPRTA